MNKITHRVTLDTKKNGIQKILQGFNAGETNIREIAISLVCGSDPYIIPVGGITPVMMVTANGITSLNACNIRDNMVIYDVVAADVAYSGVVDMQLKMLATNLTGNESVLFSPKFQLEVWGSSSADGTQSPTYTALEQALVQAQEYSNKTIKSIELDDENMLIITYMDDSYQTFDNIAKVIDLAGTVNDYLTEFRGLRDEALASAENALASETAALVSQTAAKTSEDNAKASETVALASKTSAAASADAALLSETNAKASETVALSCKTVVETKTATCVSSASAASTSETNAKTSEDNAKASEIAAATSEANALAYKIASKSYAVGGTGTRAGEDNDNASYYLTQCQQIAGSLAGGFIPMGTVAFANLPTNASAGWMYNISDSFTSDNRFKDGSGILYAAGANIYLTADGLWDVLTYGVPTVNGKQGLSITVGAEDINVTGYSKATGESAIVVTDTVNQALGKLEYKTDEVDTKITTAIGTLPTEVSTLTSDVSTLQTKVTKIETIISGTLVAGETTLTISDESITTDSIIEPYQQIGTSATSIIAPLTILVDTGVCTMTFDAQDSDVTVGIRVI